nr:TIGR03747 family integrating conjugative element membrane protein [Pantoea cypripedii]
MAELPRNPQAQSRPVRRPGILANLLWNWPWALVGVVLSSLFLSLLMEYIGIAFFWPEAGATHSEEVMKTELGWLSTEFTRSLLLTAPSETLLHQIMSVYNGLLACSGWLQSIGNGSVYQPVTWISWLLGYLHEYLMATVWITIITMIRLMILLLSLPLFVMVVLVALVEGLGRRDLRRYGAGYESSFVYHHAKKLVKPVAVVPTMLYLSWPAAVWPNLFLLPAAILLGIAITVATASFKKYL